MDIMLAVRFANLIAYSNDKSELSIWGEGSHENMPLSGYLYRIRLMHQIMTEHAVCA